jgi:predicted nucleotidyltransferase
MSNGALPSIILDALQALVAWLADEQVPNAIIGAVGVSLIAQSRSTQDIDGVIWVDDDRWEALMTSAVEHGFALRISDAMTFARRARMLLLKHETTGVKIDLSFGGLPFERELIERASTVIEGDLSVRVATPEDLIITKAVANRPKDIADIELILAVHQTLDVSRIRYWVREFAVVLEMPEIEDALKRVLKHRAKLSSRSGILFNEPLAGHQTMEDQFPSKVDLRNTKSIGPSGEVWAGSEIIVGPAEILIDSKKINKKSSKKRRKKKKK